MSIIAFTGGSITSGVGWNLPEEQDYMWVNLLHKNCFSDLKLVNAGTQGTTNEEIFRKTLKLIADEEHLSILICSWVSLIRQKFSVGLELWPTEIVVNGVTPLRIKDFKLSTGILPTKYLSDLKNRFLSLFHYHYEIKKILEYINIINKLCAQKNIQIYHVNDSCPWDKNYFVELNNVKPEQYTNFTKSTILNIEQRSDEEIFQLYKKLHEEYRSLGGVQEHTWVNLYDSWLDNITDYNHDGFHPGKQSNFYFYTVVKNFLEK